MSKKIFHANAADHSISNIHFIVHSIIIASISVLSSKQSPDHIIIFLISIIGILIAIVTAFTLIRAKLYRLYWESKTKFRENYNKFLEKEFNNKCKKCLSDCIGNNSREFIVLFISIIYLIFIFHNIKCTNI